MGKLAEAAEAFSSHRFSEAYEALADDVQWVAVGGSTTSGRSAVMDICEGTTRELTGTAVEFLRFVVVDGGDTVAVDSVARYVDETGDVTRVASCDIYESRAGRIATITSYAVEVQ